MPLRWSSFFSLSTSVSIDFAQGTYIKTISQDLYLSGEGMEINYRPSLLKCFFWQNVTVGQGQKVQRMHFGKIKHINRIIDFALSFKLVEVNLMGSMFCHNQKERNFNTSTSIPPANILYIPPQIFWRNSED